MAETILVIDDEKSVRRLLEVGLQRQGFETLTAATGSEGLETAKQRQPNLVILDIRMPGMDGWEVLRQLKADATTSEIPVIVVAVRDEDNPPPGPQAGYAEFLFKPVDMQNLVTQMRVALNH